jgi:divalent metal cation (Fe/Co/Zn/Cd) transporter
MKRVVALLTGLVLLATASLLGLYGLFAILYRGDSRGSGDTYVPLVGHDVDADLVGAVALLLAVVLILLSIPVLRRKRRFARRS